jgi:hypothetical protein
MPHLDLLTVGDGSRKEDGDDHLHDGLEAMIWSDEPSVNAGLARLNAAILIILALIAAML